MGWQPGGSGLDAAPDSCREGQAGGSVALLQAFQQCQIQLRALLEGAGKIYRSLLFVDNLDEFLRVEPQILSGQTGGPGLPVQESIRIEGVSFTSRRIPSGSGWLRS